MLTSIQPTGVTPEENLRNSSQARKHARDKCSLALKPRADITRIPKHGYQWPHEKDLCSPKFFLKNETQQKHRIPCDDFYFMFGGQLPDRSNYITQLESPFKVTLFCSNT